jgi:hypothetical protein
MALINATLDINRTGNSDTIEIRLKLETGRSITMAMTAENFALCLTGKSEVFTGVRTRNVEIVYTEKPKAKPRQREF